MSDMNNIPQIENALHRLFPSPKEAFLDRLEKKLLTQTAARGENEQKAPAGLWADLKKSIQRHQRAAIVLGLTLMGAAVVMVIGPQRVLGAMGSLFDRVYVPGVGFMDAEGVRMLPAPVVEMRDGVTLTVEQVLAESDRTVVMLGIEGVPVEELNEYAQGSYLLLPDGKGAFPRNLYVEWTKITWEMSPLPADALEISLVWDTWSGRSTIHGAWWQDTSGAWVIPLTLEYVGASDELELPFTYSLPDASDTHREITVQVSEVNQSVEGTAMRLQIQWPAEASFDVFSNLDIELRDEFENTYQVDPTHHWNDAFQTEYNDPQNPALYSTWQETIIFTPGAMDAEQFALLVESVQVDDNVGISFKMDLGPNPQVGDSWPLDVWFEAAGISIHINSVRLVEIEMERVVESRAAGKQDTLALEFSLDPLPIEDGDSLDVLSLSSPIELTDVILSYYEDESSGASLISLPIGDAQHPLPDGPFRVDIGFVVLSFNGPWIITWDVPEMEE
jgi:hypothetical protein